ncbi:FixH family protein, partial [Alteromonas sp. MCA-1]|uniref:FixH family protein n=1 Tax=Alteromonas sp. MCA-1 TaxID=2917731 RepID=UPI001EF79982
MCIRDRNITTDLTIEDGSIALEFHSGIPQEGNAVKLSFYHVTLEERDVSVLLSRDAKGIYRGFVEEDLDGKWRVSLTPIDDSWKIQNTIYLPHSGKMKFNP